MSAAITRSKSRGHSSRSQPCSVMSGHTPVAMSRSTARTSSTSTPLRRMISIEISMSPSVCEGSGLRFSVQLMNRARRSEYSWGFSPPGADARSIGSARSSTLLLLVVAGRSVHADLPTAAAPGPAVPGDIRVRMRGVAGRASGRDGQREESDVKATSSALGALVGAAAALGSRALLRNLILIKLRRDLRALNSGDYRRCWRATPTTPSCASPRVRAAGPASTAVATRSRSSCGTSWKLVCRVRSRGFSCTVRRGR